MSDTSYITKSTLNKVHAKVTPTTIDIITLTSEKKTIDTKLLHDLTVRPYHDTTCHSFPGSVYAHTKLPIDRKKIPTRASLAAKMASPCRSGQATSSQLTRNPCRVTHKEQFPRSIPPHRGDRNKAQWSFAIRTAMG